jgi:exonuclease V gamma subunit
MASLSLYTSNRLVNLSAELAQLLAGPGSSPLEQEIVIVPSLGIRRWLSNWKS